MPPKTEAEKHIKVRIACPHCGAAGKVDMSALDRSFVCGQCKKSFHIDVNQTRKGVRKEAPQEQDPAKVQLNLDRASVFEKFLAGIPRPVKMALPAALGLFALWWLVGEWLLPGQSLPEGLEDRARILALGLLQSDSRPIRQLQHGGNSTDSSHFVKTCRPTWPKLADENAYRIATKVTLRTRNKQAEKTGFQENANVVLELQYPAAATNNKVELNTYWVQKTSDLGWYLDIKRTQAGLAAAGS